MKSIQDPSFSARQNTKPLQNELQGFCADGGGRTRTPVRAGDFKSPVSAIPPHPQAL